MNKLPIILVFLFFLSVSNFTYGQETPTQDIPAIEISSISLSIPGSTKKLKFGNSSDGLFQALGKPTKAEKYYFEIDEKYAMLYQYDGNEIYFLDGKLHSFDLNTTSIQLNIGENSIKIGDPISSIASLFDGFDKKRNHYGGYIRTGETLVDCCHLSIDTNGFIVTLIRFHVQ
ncbi:hypothetical protein [Algoriphagus zhangzhouensis]|uniref:Uncharacterized protein n=1 Tax=Algoriphagus zhangzhouensis TaxID=1073327 RepID=A0A1M7ZGF6_9BACT|nr:hypothetical protein [Algoriphagus zhangzhouensis]TDY44786.1 hypothetical protein A8938_2997 [Algoriphagus zhangzhouensis]SHO63922.1 hypothetical protein SAMN04488108_3088 [Algoriphagus zhangzhouensis]